MREGKILNMIVERNISYVDGDIRFIKPMCPRTRTHGAVNCLK